MLGKDFYKIEANCELSSERLKSLVFFYGPLIGHDALALYEYLVLKGNTFSFNELNSLLSSLNISVDSFESQCAKLNEYRLLKTLKNENKYILVFVTPLTRMEFIKDSILVRDFILKTSGTHYQELISDIYEEDNHSDFEDISQTLSLEALNNWTKDNETYLDNNRTKNSYNFNTLFDINTFLKDMSTNLLPMKFRTETNLKEIATLADLYNISYDKMRTYIPEVCDDENNNFNLNLLKYKCMNAKTDYQKVQDGNYGVPCLSFLMSLQDGKEVTDYDKKIIMALSEKYHLNPSVINVLMEHTLKSCDNRLIEKYIYAIASDLHRNNVVDAKGALARLQRSYNSKSRDNKELPTYNVDNNKKMSKEEEEEILKLMGKK